MPAPRKQSPQRRSTTAKRVVLAGPDSSSKEATVTAESFPDGIPAPPEEISRYESIEAWNNIWAEPQAKAFTKADLIILHRYITAYDEWVGAMASISLSPTVDGSQGQPVANPLMGWAQSREAVMERCEAQLGIGLKNRTHLGISVGVAKMTAAQLNAMVRGGPSGDTSTGGRKPRRTKKEIAAAKVEAEIIEAFEIE